MASFRTHLSLGAALGAVSVVAIISSALVPVEWSFFALVAAAVTVGAIAPDIDSDSGIPFHITFSMLSLIAGILMLVHGLRHMTGDWPRIIGYSLGVMAFVWVVIGAVFKKFTRHRGMAHSVPAAVLAGLLLATFSGRAGFLPQESFLLGIAMSLGYLLHLVLDEVYAAVNFHGRPFVPNKAFGSALKLTSQSGLANCAVYGAVICLSLANAPLLQRVGWGFMSTLR